MRAFAVPGLLCLMSCQSVMYVPNMQNVPMLSEKKDFQATFSLRDFQLAYAPTNHLGVVANGFYRTGAQLYLSNGKTGDRNAEGYLIEGGIGTFKSNNRNSTSIYGGFGHGFSSFSYTEYNLNTKTRMGGNSHFNKVYIQPNLAFRARARSRAALSVRLGFIDFYDFEDLQSANANQEGVGVFFFEPAFTLRRYSKNGNISVLGQIQYSSPVGINENREAAYAPYKGMLVAKLAFTFHQYRRKQTQTEPIRTMRRLLPGRI